MTFSWRWLVAAVVAGLMLGTGSAFWWTSKRTNVHQEEAARLRETNAVLQARVLADSARIDSLVQDVARDTAADDSARAWTVSQLDSLGTVVDNLRHSVPDTAQFIPRAKFDSLLTATGGVQRVADSALAGWTASRSDVGKLLLAVQTLQTDLSLLRVNSDSLVRSNKALSRDVDMWRARALRRWHLCGGAGGTVSVAPATGRLNVAPGAFGGVCYNIW